ncbi:hypothetical protein HG531_007100 [Fusarium graminearum]|nr:hypothetical protein HG531_007100 [Fusarium graminearum]
MVSDHGDMMVAVGHFEQVDNKYWTGNADTLLTGSNLSSDLGGVADLVEMKAVGIFSIWSDLLRPLPSSGRLGEARTQHRVSLHQCMNGVGECVFVNGLCDRKELALVEAISPVFVVTVVEEQLLNRRQCKWLTVIFFIFGIDGLFSAAFFLNEGN